MNKYITGNKNSVPYISNCFTPTQAQPGTVWFDSGTQSMQVYDGQNWIPLQTPEPMLTFEAEEALDKIIAQMQAQPVLSDMADKYPLVEEAIRQLEVVLKLCQNLE